MNTSLLILIGTQVLFSASDLIGRAFMAKHGFTLSTFLSAWFIVYFLVRTVAMFGLLYVFANIQLGRSMALFGVASIVSANVLGFLVLRETLNMAAYMGVMIAIIAFLVLALVRS